MSENPEPTESLPTPDAPPPTEPKADPLGLAVEIWFNDLRRTLSSHGLPTEVHNLLYTAKEDLKVRLSGLTA